MEAVEHMRGERTLECKLQVHLEMLTLQTANFGPGEGLKTPLVISGIRALLERTMFNKLLLIMLSLM